VSPEHLEDPEHPANPENPEYSENPANHHPVTAPIDADDTSRAYFASTPV
jgi:hypothetical protein